MGQSYGTVGFAAPELSNDAHAATFAADIYSLGQIIGWALVGQEPHANVPLLPSTEPWRGVAKAATRFDAAQRPQSCDAFLALLASELDEPPEVPANAGEALLAELRGGDSSALHRLCALAARNPQDYDLYIDVLPQLTDDEVIEAVRRDRPATLEVAEAMARHVGGDWQYRDFKWANAVIRLPWRIARRAAADQDWELLESAFETVAQWDELWDQWDVQKAIRSWLRDLKGDAARITARILQVHPDSAPHFADLADDRRVDQRLRAAVRQT